MYVDVMPVSYVKCMLWVLQNYVSCHVAALLKLYIIGRFTLYFKSKFYVFSGQMELLHKLCKSYVFKWILKRVDDTEMKEPRGKKLGIARVKIQTTSIWMNNF